MVQPGRCEEGTGCGGESLMPHTLIPHLVRLSASQSGPQGHHWRGRGVRRLILTVLEWEASLPMILLAITHLAQKNRAKAGTSHLPISPGGKWTVFGEHVELFVTVFEILESNPSFYRWANWRPKTEWFSTSHMTAWWQSGQDIQFSTFWHYYCME